MSLTSDIIANICVWYGGVAQVQTEVSEVGTNVQSVSINEGPLSNGQRFMARV
jgi:hypothetical protein